MTQQPDRDLREGPLPRDPLLADDGSRLDETSEPVGVADAEADRARSGVDVDPDALAASRADEGEPTGADERDADVAASGGDPNRV